MFMYKTTLTPLRILRVSARLMSILMFILWGYVFLIHIAWFLPPNEVPPLRVWFGQAINAGLVISYPLLFWKEKAAAILMVFCAFIFFFFMIGSSGAVAYFFLAILPAILFFIGSRLKKGTTTPGR